MDWMSFAVSPEARRRREAGRRGNLVELDVDEDFFRLRPAVGDSSVGLYSDAGPAWCLERRNRVVVDDSE
jgi:hypothetical protein